MSGVVGRTPAPATAGAPPATTGGARSAAAVMHDSLSMRLVAFAALGAFGAAHWGLLVEDPPVAGRSSSSWWPPAAPLRSGCSGEPRSRGRHCTRWPP